MNCARRHFLGTLGRATACPLLVASNDDLPPLPGASTRLPVTGATVQIRQWREFCLRHPSQYAREQVRVPLARVWSTIVATLRAAPRLVYRRGAVARWQLAEEIGDGTGNCNTMMLTLRRDLGARGIPLGALPPVIVDNGSADWHLQMMLLTEEGDLAFDWAGRTGIGIAGPLSWERFPVRWLYRYRARLDWDRLRDAA